MLKRGMQKIDRASLPRLLQMCIGDRSRIQIGRLKCAFRKRGQFGGARLRASRFARTLAPPKSNWLTAAHSGCLIERLKPIRSARPPYGLQNPFGSTGTNRAGGSPDSRATRDRAYGLALPLANALAAAFWNSRRTSLASLLGKLERCTIRT
jgi:hypothetical protein